MLHPLDLTGADLVFTTSNRPRAWLIRTVTGSFVSHVMVYLGDGTVVEAHKDEGKVVRRPLCLALERATCAEAYRHRDVDADGASAIRLRALALVGRRYDTLGAISTRLASPFASNDPYAYYCSELVCTVFAAARLAFGPRGRVAPGDIARHPAMTCIGSLRAPA